MVTKALVLLTLNEIEGSKALFNDIPLNLFNEVILVDGGKGQLNAGFSVLKELGIEGIPIIGLAKKFEEIFVPNKKEPIILPRNSNLLKIFQRVRDEAHRFAVKLHKASWIKLAT